MTAVEQFIEQLEKQGDSWENVSIGRIQISIKVEDYIELQRQAKAMEKEQIIDAYYQIGKDHQDMIFPIEKNAEQYYTQTYESNTRI